jgi:uncharacterized membrane protein YesL
MFAAFHAVWRGLRHFNDRSSIYVAANLIAFLLSIPLITAPAAWAGLVKMSLLSQTTPTASPADMWNAFRTYLRQGLVMGVLNIVIIGINLSNLAMYWYAPGLLYAVLRGVWLLVLVLWLATQIYLWPLFFNMTQPTLRGALRNAVVMILLNPVFTLVLILAMGVIVLISIILVIPWALLTLSMLVSVATAAVLDRLEAAGLREPPPPPPEEFSPSDLS